MSSTGNRRDARRIRICIGILAAIAAIWVVSAGRALVSTQPATMSDAVVVLSGDAYGDRLDKAIDVLLATGSSRLVVDPSGPNAVYRGRAELLRYIASSGVPTEAVRLLDPASSTAVEASELAGLADRCGWRSMTLVTSPYHTRRAEWTFARAMPGVRISAVSDGEAFHSGTWFLHGSDVRSVVSEWGKAVGSLWYLVSPPGPLDPGMTC